MQLGFRATKWLDHRNMMRWWFFVFVFHFFAAAPGGAEVVLSSSLPSALTVVVTLHTNWQQHGCILRRRHTIGMTVNYFIIFFFHQTQKNNEKNKQKPASVPANMSDMIQACSGFLWRDAVTLLAAHNPALSGSMSSPLKEKSHLCVAGKLQSPGGNLSSGVCVVPFTGPAGCLDPSQGYYRNALRERRRENRKRLVASC